MESILSLFLFIYEFCPHYFEPFNIFKEQNLRNNNVKTNIYLKF